MGIWNALFNEGDIRNLFGEEVENTPGAPKSFQEAWLFQNVIKPLLGEPAYDPKLTSYEEGRTPEEIAIGKKALLGLSSLLPDVSPPAGMPYATSLASKEDLREPPGTTAPGGAERAAEAKKKAMASVANKARGGVRPMETGTASDDVKKAVALESLATEVAPISSPAETTITPPTTPKPTFPTPPKVKETNLGEELSKLVGQLPQSYDELAGGPSPTWYTSTAGNDPFNALTYIAYQMLMGKDPYEETKKEEVTLRSERDKKAEYAKWLAEKKQAYQIKGLEAQILKEKEEKEGKKQFIDATLKSNKYAMKDPGFVRFIGQTYGIPDDYAEQIIANNTDKNGEVSGFMLSEDQELGLRATAKANFLLQMFPNEITPEQAKRYALLEPAEFAKKYNDGNAMADDTIAALSRKKTMSPDKWTPADEKELQRAVSIKKLYLKQAAAFGMDEYNEARANIIKAQTDQMNAAMKEPSMYNAKTGKWTPKGQEFIRVLEYDTQMYLGMAGDKLALGKEATPQSAKSRLEGRFLFLYPDLRKGAGTEKESKFLPPTSPRDVATFSMYPGYNLQSAESSKLREDRYAHLGNMETIYRMSMQGNKARAEKGQKPINLVEAGSKRFGQSADYYRRYTQDYENKIRNMGGGNPEWGKWVDAGISAWGSAEAIPPDVWDSTIASGNPTVLYRSYVAAYGEPKAPKK